MTHPFVQPSKVGLTILLTGASGFVGSNLKGYLESAGHQVISLSRSNKKATDPFWNYEVGEIRIPSDLRFDAVIHLAGEPIASSRWTEEKKGKIEESRVKGTAMLCNALTRIKNPLKTFLSASAVGFYGNRNNEVLTEESSKGSGFLSDVVQKWEEASIEKLSNSSIRICHLRFGVILSAEGGALKKMLLPFKYGLGGKLGDGLQWMSWVTLNDTLSSIYHCLLNETLTGAVNITAPEAVTNTEFTKTLGKVLQRPTRCTVPKSVLRFVVGELADEALLSSTRALPHKLTQSGFQFSSPRLEEGLRKVLGK